MPSSPFGGLATQWGMLAASKRRGSGMKNRNVFLLSAAVLASGDEAAGQEFTDSIAAARAEIIGARLIAAGASDVDYDGIPPLASTPRLTTAIFGLGGHDVQPRHIVAASSLVLRQVSPWSSLRHT